MTIRVSQSKFSQFHLLYAMQKIEENAFNPYAVLDTNKLNS